MATRKITILRIEKMILNLTLPKANKYPKIA